MSGICSSTFFVLLWFKALSDVCVDQKHWDMGAKSLSVNMGACGLFFPQPFKVVTKVMIITYIEKNSFWLLNNFHYILLTPVGFLAHIYGFFLPALTEPRKCLQTYPSFSCKYSHLRFPVLSCHLASSSLTVCLILSWSVLRLTLYIYIIWRTLSLTQFFYYLSSHLSFSEPHKPFIGYFSSTSPCTPLPPLGGCCLSYPACNFGYILGSNFLYKTLHIIWTVPKTSDFTTLLESFLISSPSSPSISTS